MKPNKVFIVLMILVAAGILIGHLFFHKTLMTPMSQNMTPNTVEIQNYAFNPQKLTIKKGTTITWTNDDLVPHTVTMDDSSKAGPNSQALSKGQSYSYTFSEVGTYSYHCEPHPYMKATVEVTE